MEHDARNDFATAESFAADRPDVSRHFRDVSAAQGGDMNENVCVFPGSFNPFTLGHRHLAELALEKYDKVIIAVAGETYKGDMLGADERVKIARESLANDARFDVKYFSGMLTDFLAETGCFNVVRGNRDEKTTNTKKSWNGYTCRWTDA